MGAVFAAMLILNAASYWRRLGAWSRMQGVKSFASRHHDAGLPI